MIAAAETEDVAKAGLRVMVSERQVLEVVPVSTVTLWRMVRKNTFPKPTFITPNKKVWYLDEIVAWQAEVNGRGRGRRQRPTRSE